MQQANANIWKADEYHRHFAFVSAMTEDLVDLLNTQPGERILDIGCGTGRQTAQIAEAGAMTIGMDASAEMIEQARSHYPDMQWMVADMANFALDEPVDAIFSNAAIHWCTRPNDMLACVNRVLKPQGRFVVEFGGKDNIKHFLSALTESWQTVTGEPTPELITRRWYFPSPDEYTVLLDSHDFAVNYLSWFDRPTPLPHGELGLRAWLAMFMNDAMSLLPEDVQKQVYEQVEARLKPVLWNPDTLQWDADYKRLRIVATKNP